ncbi:MAG: hypothetical protein ACFBWO_01310 [Paracoccaceae bacterium]
MRSEPSSETPPTRIFVLLASEARLGVVLAWRRYTCCFLWRLEDDVLERGNCMGAQLYPERSDLSPDGRHLIYFAASHKPDDPRSGAWTSISRPPWLKAVAFYPEGLALYGGGFFLSNETWVFTGHGYRRSASTFSDESGLVRMPPPHPAVRGIPSSRAAHLRRSGWEVTTMPGEDVRFERSLGRHWRLLKTRRIPGDPGRGRIDERTALVAEDGRRIDCPDWDWADADPRTGDLLYAQAGRLWRQPVTGRRGWPDPTLVADLNGMRFANGRAPY